MKPTTPRERLAAALASQPTKKSRPPRPAKPVAPPADSVPSPVLPRLPADLEARRLVNIQQAIEQHTQPPETRQQLQGELQCRLQEQVHITREIEVLNEKLLRLPA